MLVFDIRKGFGNNLLCIKWLLLSSKTETLNRIPLVIVLLESSGIQR